SLARPYQPCRRTPTSAGLDVAADAAPTWRASWLVSWPVICLIAPLKPPSAEAPQHTRKTPHPGCRQFGREEGDRGALSHLHIGRIWHNQIRKGATIKAKVDGQCPCADLLAGRGTNDGCAQDQSLGVGYHL